MLGKTHVEFFVGSVQIISRLDSQRKVQLEYEYVVWSPFTVRNITKLERVQRRATKFILKTEDGYEATVSKT